MNDETAKRQIAAMVSFIMQEAKEKAEDIKRETDNEFTADKLNRIRLLTLSIKEEYARKRKERLVSKRIDRSRRQTEARIKKMRKREEMVQRVKDEVVEKLSQVGKSPKYPDLVRFLIMQALVTIGELRIVMQCRQEDMAVVKKELDPSIKAFQAYVQQHTGVSPKCVVDISHEHLPPAPTKGRNAASCCGGIIMSARNGQIVCANTLDARLDLAFRGLIPQIRGVLFGVRERPPAKAQPQPHSH